MVNKLQPIWDRYNAISDDEVKVKMEEGNERARSVAQKTMEEVREAIKIMY